MNPVLEVVVSNAIVAAGLAVVVFAVTRIARRPALAAGLWLLVLAKLVTPPVWTVPVGGWIGVGSSANVACESRPAGAQQTEGVVSGPASDEGVRPESRSRLPGGTGLAYDVVPTPNESDGRPSEDHAPRGERASSEPLPKALAGETGGIDAPAASVAPAAQEPRLAPTVPLRAEMPETAQARAYGFARGLPWTSALLAVWLAGTLVLTAVTLVRAVRFERLVRRLAAGSVCLQDVAREMSRRLGMRSPPQVVVAAGRVPPLLWAFRRAVIVLPRDLLDALGSEEQRMLVAHELAHYRRGDHLVRWFEMIVAAVYWWHPVVWWARRELRRAEEACCDAWVLWAFPGGERAYAHLLLDTLDFLSGARTVRPALASGFGPAKGLQRRLNMILKNETSHRLSGRTRLGLAAAGLVVLGVSIGWGQPEPGEPRPAAPAAARASEPASEPDVAVLPALSEPMPQADDVAVEAAEPSQAVPEEPKVAQPTDDGSARFRSYVAPSAVPPEGHRSAPEPAQRTAEQLESRQQKIAAALISALGDPDQKVRLAAVMGLARVARSSDEALSAIVDFYHQADDVEEVRYTTFALGQFAPTRSSIKALIAALGHNDESVRQTAKTAFRSIGGRPAISRGSADALVDALRHSDKPVQDVVRSTLLNIGSVEIVGSLAAAISGGFETIIPASEQATLRQNAWETLSAISPASNAVLEALADLLSHLDPRVRSAAVEAISKSRIAFPDKLIDALIAAAKDDDSGVRRDAIRALGSDRVSQTAAAPAIYAVPAGARTPPRTSTR